MKKSGIALLVFIAITALYAANAQSCSTCNCQFYNIQVLAQLVKAEVKSTLADEPLLRLLRLAMDGSRRLTLFAANHTTLVETDAKKLANISLTNPSENVTSSNNLLAYRPQFADWHSRMNNLAGVFINVEGVFPCLQSLSGYNPLCQVLSDEEDGFRSGKALIGAADTSWHVFSSTGGILTYGIAIQECPEFTTFCFPSWHSFTVACYLPRAACS